MGKVFNFEAIKTLFSKAPFAKNYKKSENIGRRTFFFGDGHKKSARLTSQRGGAKDALRVDKKFRARSRNHRGLSVMMENLHDFVLGSP